MVLEGTFTPVSSCGLSLHLQSEQLSPQSQRRQISRKRMQGPWYTLWRQSSWRVGSPPQTECAELVLTLLIVAQLRGKSHKVQVFRKCVKSRNETGKV
jgi:hypothetical protein